MNISTVQSTQCAYGGFFTQKTSKPAAESVSGQSAGADKVDISHEARAMAEKGKTEQVGQVKTGAGPNDPSMTGDSGRELMCIPEVFHDLLPSTFRQAKIGAPTYTGRTLGADEVQDQNEYIGMLAKIYREERDKLGMQSNEEYFYQTKNNDNLKDEIYNSVVSRLATDSRAIELMDQFGITSS